MIRCLPYNIANEQAVAQELHDIMDGVVGSSCIVIGRSEEAIKVGNLEPHLHSLIQHKMGNSRYNPYKKRGTGFTNNIALHDNGSGVWLYSENTINRWSSSLGGSSVLGPELVVIIDPQTEKILDRASSHVQDAIILTNDQHIKNKVDWINDIHKQVHEMLKCPECSLPAVNESHRGTKFICASGHSWFRAT